MALRFITEVIDLGVDVLVFFLEGMMLGMATVGLVSHGFINL